MIVAPSPFDRTSDFDNDEGWIMTEAYVVRTLRWHPSHKPRRPSQPVGDLLEPIHHGQLAERGDRAVAHLLPGQNQI